MAKYSHMLPDDKKSTVTLFAIGIMISLLGCQATYECKSPQDASPHTSGQNSGEQSPAEDITEEQELPFKSIAEAEEEIANLEAPTARTLAPAIQDIDGWLVSPQEEAEFQDFKIKQLKELRNLVTKEVEQHQKAALDASTAKEGSKELEAAGDVLALFPMSEERGVVEEARRLSAQQLEVSTRLEVLRRQRYNRWAVDQIEHAIKYYNENVSRFDPRNDNSSLIGPLVSDLGPVDPLFLEPVVANLYGHILDRMKDALPEEKWLQLAKALTNSEKIKRKALDEV